MAQQKISTMNLCDAKTHLLELARRVQMGESITILKHHIPIMRLIPISEEKKTKYTKKEAIEQLHNFSKGRTLGNITIEELIAEGRKH